MSSEMDPTHTGELSAEGGASGVDEVPKTDSAEESIELARGGGTAEAPEDSLASSPLALSGDDESNSSRSDDSSSSSGDSEFFEVEKIVGHKKMGEKNHYKIRWHKFTAKDDTWEPEENLVGSNIPQLIEQFWEEQRQKKKGKGGTKAAASTRKSTTPITERDHNEEEVEANDSWFGIRPDESSREARRLFVADRIMSETEKILAEVPEGVRVLRRHLRPQLGSKKRGGKANTTSTPSTSRAKSAKSKRKSEPAAPLDKTSAGSSKKAKKGKVSSGNSADLFTADGSSPPPTDVSVTVGGRTASASVAPVKEEPIIDSLAAGSSKSSLRPTIVLANRQPAPTVQPKSIPPTALSSMKPKGGALKRRDLKVEPTVAPSHSTTNATASKKATPVEDILPLEPLSLGTELAAHVAKLREEWAERRSVETNEPISQQQLEEEVLEGSVETVRKALATSKNRFDLENTDSAGKTMLHRVSELKCGSSHIQCELIDILVLAGARMDARDAKRGQIPLHHAIENRRLCHVRKLLALRSPINIPDYRDQPPIVAAFNCSDSEFVTCLLNAGATFQPVFRAKPSENKHLLKKVMNHQNRLSVALDAARAMLTKNMTFRTVSPIFVNPLHEQRSVEHGFRCDNATLASPHHAFVVLLALADFTSEKMEARTWGASPVASVSVDGKECQLLSENSKFLYLCSPRQGYNTLNIELSPACGQWDEGLKLLTQVMQMQLVKGTSGSGEGRRGASSKPVAPVQPVRPPYASIPS